jgi:AhpD family alkylhydroperoxidase
MTLTKAEQELVAIGASIGAGCHPCTEYHLEEGARAGLTREQLFQALADAECVKRSAYNELVVRSRELLGAEAELPPSCCDDTSIAREFVSVGAAIGANAIGQLRKHIAQARSVGIDLTQLAHAVEIAQNVQRHAADFTAKEAKLLTQPVAAAHAPVFLTAPTSAGGSDAECGPDCGCHEAAAPASAAASACCGDESAIPVAVRNSAPGKCC